MCKKYTHKKVYVLLLKNEYEVWFLKKKEQAMYTVKNDHVLLSKKKRRQQTDKKVWLYISENEERKEFTYSEWMDYAQQLERIEAKKSKDRMAVKKQGVDLGPQVKKGKTRDIVGEATSFGNRY